MKKKRVLISSFILGSVLVFLIVCIILHRNKNLDIWIGGYWYEKLYPHNSGEMYYWTDYSITIWKHNHEYYARIECDGWQLNAQELAYVSGDDKKIDIIALQTLPGDISYGTRERYEKGAVLVRFERDGEKIITEWCELRDQHHLLCEREDIIIGNYFEKVR